MRVSSLLDDRKGIQRSRRPANIVTGRMRLMPFSLAETSAFLTSKRIGLGQAQILEIHRTPGGIPYYLLHLNPGGSAAQYLDRRCFDPQGMLRSEFHNRYQPLFRHAFLHEKVIQVLSKKPMGLTRTEILNACGKPSGGSYSKTPEELEESGYIIPYLPFGKKSNDRIYRLPMNILCFSEVHCKWPAGKRRQAAPAGNPNLLSMEGPCICSRLPETLPTG